MFITASVEENLSHFDCSVSQSNETINAVIDSVLYLDGTKTVYADDIDVYTGAYRVAPKSNPQTLDTKNKMLKQDVVVDPISMFVVSNQTGKTVIIGG